MSLPLKANNTCDIYRNGTAPPSAPAVAGVPIYYKPDYPLGQEGNEGDPTHAWTHIILLGPTVDIRDGYSGGAYAGLRDSVYIPDKDNTVFYVLFVERVNRGTATDHKRAYLIRGAVPQPSNEV